MVESFHRLVAFCVYYLLETSEVVDGDLEEVKGNLLRIHDLIMEGGDREEVVNLLHEVAQRLKGLKKKVEDPHVKTHLEALSVLHAVLRSVYMWDMDLHVLSVRHLKKALRLADRLGYREPYLATLSLLAATLFRVDEHNVKDLERYVPPLLSAADEMDKDPFPVRIMVLEAAAYLGTVYSSDVAFKYVIGYGSLLRESDGEEFRVLMERMLSMVDAVFMRLAYEIKAGKILPYEVDWAEDANSLLNWMEKVSENDLTFNTYVKLLNYAIMRTAYLDGAPMGVGERLKRAKPNLQTLVRFSLASMGYILKV